VVSLPPDLEHFDCGWLLRVARASEPDGSGITCGHPWIEGVRFEHVRVRRRSSKLGVGASRLPLVASPTSSVCGDQVFVRARSAQSWRLRCTSHSCSSSTSGTSRAQPRGY
jgi:hypothetical protein